MGGACRKCVDDVPDHLLLEIFKYLSAKDRCQCERLFAHVMLRAAYTMKLRWVANRYIDIITIYQQYC